MDEAIVYFGTHIENELEKAGHKPSKEERKAQAARQRVLDKYLGRAEGPEGKGSGFADPALMFN